MVPGVLLGASLLGCAGEASRLQALQQRVAALEAQLAATSAARAERLAPDLEPIPPGRQPRVYPGLTRSEREVAITWEHLDWEALKGAGGHLTPELSPSGEVVGYRLGQLNEDAFLAQLGFGNGDLVQRVNGYPLRSIEESMAVSMALFGAERLEFEVLRRGEPLLVSVRVERTRPAARRSGRRTFPL